MVRGLHQHQTGARPQRERPFLVQDARDVSVGYAAAHAAAEHIVSGELALVHRIADAIAVLIAVAGSEIDCVAQPFKTASAAARRMTRKLCMFPSP